MRGIHKEKGQTATHVNILKKKIETILNGMPYPGMSRDVPPYTLAESNQDVPPGTCGAEGRVELLEETPLMSCLLQSSQRATPPSKQSRCPVCPVLS